MKKGNIAVPVYIYFYLGIKKIEQEIKILEILKAGEGLKMNTE